MEFSKLPYGNFTSKINETHLKFTTRREFFKEILYNNIAIIAIQHSKINVFDNFGDFSHTF